MCTTTASLVQQFAALYLVFREQEDKVVYERTFPKFLYDCLSEGVAKGPSETLNKACRMRRQQVYMFPSCWDFGREDTEQRPLSRTQPTAKGNPNLHASLLYWMTKRFLLV